MKTRSNGRRAFSDAASSRSFGRSIRSILLRIRIFGRFTSGSFARIASFSSSPPLRTSTRRQTASASPAPPHAEVTIARSRRRFGAKMPGVSTKMICAAPSIAMPRTTVRVVWTLRETIETFDPTSAFEQRRLAGVRRADEGGKAAARLPPRQAAVRVRVVPASLP